MKMPSSLRWLIGPLVAVLALVLASGCSGTGAQSRTATTLPGITLQSFRAGPALDLGSLRGPAVLNLWASWCVPCRRELPLYQAFAQQYAGKVNVLGIDFQDPQQGKARQLIRQTGVTYPLYADPDGKLPAIGLPKVILIDPKGSVAYQKYVEITSTAQLEKLVRRHLGTPR